MTLSLHATLRAVKGCLKAGGSDEDDEHVGWEGDHEHDLAALNRVLAVRRAAREARRAAQGQLYDNGGAAC